MIQRTSGCVIKKNTLLTKIIMRFIHVFFATHKLPILLAHRKTKWTTILYYTHTRILTRNLYIVFFLIRKRVKSNVVFKKKIFLKICRFRPARKRVPEYVHCSTSTTTAYCRKNPFDTPSSS